MGYIYIPVKEETAKALDEIANEIMQRTGMKPSRHGVIQMLIKVFRQGKIVVRRTKRRIYIEWEL